ncbi:sulfite exporter TauE/SafE family protein [Rhizobium sp. 2YAF20]
MAVIILGLSKGGFAGVGMISTPLLALVVGPVNAAGFIFPVLIIQDAVAVWMYKREWSRRIVATMVPGAAVGVLAGYQLASTVPEWIVEIALGGISLIFGCRQLFLMLRSQNPVGRPPAIALGVVSGVASGFTSMIAHSGTPPFQLYAMPQKLGRDMYIGTSVVFFATLNWMKFPAFAMLGQLNREHLTSALIFAPIAIFSSWLGVRLVQRVDVARFNLIITLILIGVSLALIAQGSLASLVCRRSRLAPSISTGCLSKGSSPAEYLSRRDLLTAEHPEFENDLFLPALICDRFSSASKRDPLFETKLDLTTIKSLPRQYLLCRRHNGQALPAASFEIALTST